MWMMETQLLSHYLPRDELAVKRVGSRAGAQTQALELSVFQADFLNLKFYF